MSALERFRARARAALGDTGFLRRGEKNAALFVSDCPRRGGTGAAERLKAAGFSAREENGLLLIDLKPALLPRGGDFLPMPCGDDGARLLLSLARRLILADAPPERQPMEALRLTLHLLDKKAYVRLYDLLAPLAAEALRAHTALPSAAGIWIMEALREEKNA